MCELFTVGVFAVDLLMLWSVVDVCRVTLSVLPREIEAHVNPTANLPPFVKFGVIRDTTYCMSEPNSFLDWLCGINFSGRYCEMSLFVYTTSQKFGHQTAQSQSKSSYCKEYQSFFFFVTEY